MKWTVLLVILASMVLTGCSKVPVRTREICFYRGDRLNQGLPCAVDIIYPKDQAQMEKIVKEIGPEKWFTSDLFDSPGIHKDKAWLEKSSREVRVVLKQKDKMDPYVVVFAEFTKPDRNTPRGREPFLLYQKDMKPRAAKVEHIYVHEGSLERLAKKPKDLSKYE